MKRYPIIDEAFFEHAADTLKKIRIYIEGTGAFAHPLQATENEILHLKHIHNKLMYVLTLAGYYTLEEFTSQFILDKDISQVIIEGLLEQERKEQSINTYRTAKRACKCGICVQCTLP
jgi:hypothetical protein